VYVIELNLIKYVYFMYLLSLLVNVVCCIYECVRSEVVCMTECCRFGVQ
jgi:hypothetical protein